jgi:Na+/proline symporter
MSKNITFGKKKMSSALIIGVISAFFLLLVLISFLTGKRTDNDTFFLGNRQSPWYIVALGMIGASLSGVTFVSVPGWVGSTGFTYMQMVFGYLLGYMVIAGILLPLFYRLNVTSIYTYLEQRFGLHAYKTGAVLFLLSKTVGAAARLYLMANVLQMTLFDAIHIPFGVTVTVTILLIWAYTHRAGVKTIIYTDTIQAVVMVAAVILTFYIIADKMDLSLMGAINMIADSKYSNVFEFSDWSSKQHFVKQFFSGAFITIVMTGLDQDMMQKNLTCKNLKEAKKNMYSYAIAFIPVNLVFLGLGAMLYLYAAHISMPLPARADDLFPILATGGFLPPIVGILFMLGLVAAAYSSADSALASLTTSFSIDILRVDRMQEKKALHTRKWVHVGISVVMGLTIVIFRVFKLDTIINTIFTIAGYTYGPLLGLFAFGLITKLKPRALAVPFIAVLAPLATGVLDFYSVDIFGAAMGYEKLLVNGAFTFIMLCVASIKVPKLDGIEKQRWDAVK